MNIAHMIPEIKIKFFLARKLHCNDEYYSIISVIFQWTIRFVPSAYDKRLEESIDFFIFDYLLKTRWNLDIQYFVCILLGAFAGSLRRIWNILGYMMEL